MSLAIRVRTDTSSRAALCVILLIALAVRIYRIGTLFPIMVDESIYLRWAEIIQHQHQWFIALLDGKQPLCSWLYTPLLIFHLGDSFLAARVISALAGVATTFIIFSIADEMGGSASGLLASALYAVAPYSVFYAHLAYNEAILDLLAAISVLSALLTFCLGSPSRWTASSTGLWLGVGFLCKSSFLPFFIFPLAICLSCARDRWRLLIPTYLVAAIVPSILYLSVPRAPMSPSSHFIVHQLEYFIDRRTLAHHPLAEASLNLPIVSEYLNVYLTLPMLVASAAAFVYLARERLAIPSLMLPFTLAVLIGEIVLLHFLPSRYVFPYLWPLFIAMGCAAGRLARRGRVIPVLVLAATVLFGMSLRSGAILLAPGTNLHPTDADHFVIPNVYAGYGVSDAARFIQAIAQREGPLVLLTDPIWGLPADAMFVYLNGRDGIEVHEAWWLDLPDRYPLLPAGRIAIMKSHYERVYGGSIDFDRSVPVLYVTDNVFVSADYVRRRQHNVRRIASFRKPDSLESTDIYRLK